MTDHTVVLRDATEADAEHVAALLTELGHPATAADIPARLAAIRGEGGAVLLAVDSSTQSTPLALMALSRQSAIHAPGAIAYITALVTTNAARRRGVGVLLVTAAKEWASRNGCVRLSVTSAEHRADAHAFYPACGLAYTGRRFSTSIVPRDDR